MIWKRVILSWMTLLALAFASAGATASVDVSPKTHVGAIDLAAAICIEASGFASAEEHQGNRCLVTTVTSDVPHAARGVKPVADFATKNTKNFSAGYKSQREARGLARTKLGKNPVQVEPGKLRSADGRWQYRGKPQDLKGHGAADSPHIHLEQLNPTTGEVLQNWHLRWK